VSAYEHRSAVAFLILVVIVLAIATVVRWLFGNGSWVSAASKHGIQRVSGPVADADQVFQGRIGDYGVTVRVYVSGPGLTDFGPDLAVDARLDSRGTLPPGFSLPLEADDKSARVDVLIDDGVITWTYDFDSRSSKEEMFRRIVAAVDVLKQHANRAVPARAEA